MVVLAALSWLAWGQAPARAGSFSLKPGDLLVANYGASTVLKLDGATGAVQNLGGFDSPTDVALGSGSYLYITEFGGSIYRLNLTNGVRTLIKSPVTLDPLSDALWGVLIAPGGDLIVTRGYDNAIVSVNPSTGIAQVVSSANLLSGVSGIDLLDAAQVVVCSTFNNQVVKVALAGGAQTSVTTVGGGVDKPRGIAVSGTNLFVTALDSSQIRQVPVAGGTVETFYTAASSLFGMGALANGDIIAAMDRPPFHVLRLSPTGTLVQTFTNLLFSEVTGVDISRISLVVTGLLNTPPILEPIADLTVNEGSPVSFIASAVDTNWPLQTLSFSLGASAPAGAVISSKGVFSWVPAENQGPGVYPIQLIVTDNDSPPLSATNTLTVTVHEVNTAPVFHTITNRSAFESQRLSFQVQATDPDQPPQTLTYSLLPGAPTGATISSNGVFAWAPSDAQGPATHSVGVQVTDNGSPPLSARTNFLVTVNELYLQCAPALGAPFLDEPGVIYDWAARSLTFTNSGTESCFLRLRCNLPVRIIGLHPNTTNSFIEYQFQ